MHLICTDCDGLGVKRVYVENMDPFHNVAIYDTVIGGDGSRHSAHGCAYGGGIPVWPILAYERPCKCRDGFIDWTRGVSLTPRYP